MEKAKNYYLKMKRPCAKKATGPRISRLVKPLSSGRNNLEIDSLVCPLCDERSRDNAAGNRQDSKQNNYDSAIIIRRRTAGVTLTTATEKIHNITQCIGRVPCSAIGIMELSIGIPPRYGNVTELSCPVCLDQAMNPD
jgi:hypothetical protein